MGNNNMYERGNYGSRTVIGAAPARSTGEGTSVAKWIVGVVVVGGAVLWVKHQSDQITRLSSAAGVSYPSFSEDLRADARALSTRAGSALHGLSRRLGAGMRDEG